MVSSSYVQPSTRHLHASNSLLQLSNGGCIVSSSYVQPSISFLQLSNTLFNLIEGK